MNQANEQSTVPGEAPKGQLSAYHRRSILSLGAIFAIYVLTYLLLWPEAPVLESDSPGYMAMARDLSHGRLNQPSIRTPGYPLLLLATGSSRSPTKTLFVTGLIFHFLVLCIVMAVLRKNRAPRPAVLVSAVLLLLPYNVQSAGFVMTENLTELALVVAVCLLLWAAREPRVSSACAAGAAIGATALIRPTYQLLWVALTLSVWLAWYMSPGGNRGLKKPFIMTAVTFLVVATMLGGYCGYNQKRFGYFGLTYALGINLLDRTALFVERLPESYEPLRSSLIRLRDKGLIEGKSHTAEQYPWGRHWEELKGELGRKDDVGLAKDLARANALLILKNPLNYLLAVAKSAVGLLFPHVTTFVSRGSTLAQGLWSTMHFLTLAAFFLQLCFVLGSELWTQSLRWSGCPASDHGGERGWRLAYFVSLGGLAYTIAVSAATSTGNPRYRSPADALLIMNAALGFGLWSQRLRTARGARG